MVDTPVVGRSRENSVVGPLDSGPHQRPAEQLAEPKRPNSLILTQAATFSFLYLGTGAAVAVVFLPVSALAGAGICGAALLGGITGGIISGFFTDQNIKQALISGFAVGFAVNMGNWVVTKLGYAALPVWKICVFVFGSAIAAGVGTALVFNYVVPKLSFIPQEWKEFYFAQKKYEVAKAFAECKAIVGH